MGGDTGGRGTGGPSPANYSAFNILPMDVAWEESTSNDFRPPPPIVARWRRPCRLVLPGGMTLPCTTLHQSTSPQSTSPVHQSTTYVIMRNPLCIHAAGFSAKKILESRTYRRILDRISYVYVYHMYIICISYVPICISGRILLDTGTAGPCKTHAIN